MARNKELAERLREGAEHAEAHRDDDLGDIEASHPNRNRTVVFSIRLNPGELDVLQAIAEKTGIPASTLARGWILDGLDVEEAMVGDLGAALDRLAADVDRLRAITRS